MSRNGDGRRYQTPRESLRALLASIRTKQAGEPRGGGLLGPCGSAGGYDGSARWKNYDRLVSAALMYSWVWRGCGRE